MGKGERQAWMSYTAFFNTAQIHSTDLIPISVLKKSKCWLPIWPQWTHTSDIRATKMFTICCVCFCVCVPTVETGECCFFSDQNRISPFLPFQEFEYFMCECDATVRTSYFHFLNFTISLFCLFDLDVNTKLNEFDFNFPIERKSETVLHFFPFGKLQTNENETGQFHASHFDVDFCINDLQRLCVCVCFPFVTPFHSHMQIDCIPNSGRTCRISSLWKQFSRSLSLLADFDHIYTRN